MSASSRPTRAPSAASASARLTAVVLLPTPPLPDDTAITLATPGSRATPRCTWCAMTLLETSTATPPTPGTDCAAATSASRTTPNWLRAG